MLAASVVAWLTVAQAATPAAGTYGAPSLAALWQEFRHALPAFTYGIVEDAGVVSDSDPRQQLRRLDVMFYSQEIDGRTWGHPSGICMPSDRRVRSAASALGQVVIVGQRSIDGLATGSWRSAFLGNYGEPIAARTGYPTMVVPVPGPAAPDARREGMTRVV